MPGLHGRLVIAALVIEALAMLGPSLAHAQNAATVAEIDRVMEQYRLDAHIPGMVWGVVKGGKLVHVQGTGVQDINAKRPVRPDAVPHRLDDQGVHGAVHPQAAGRWQAVALDALAETYVPELKALTYPTEDSPKIRVRELITHTAGFVTDDPWGDRQTPMSEADFSRYLASARAGHSRVRRAPRWNTRTWATRCSDASSATCRRRRTTSTCSERFCGPLGMMSTSHHVTSRGAN